MSRYTKRDYQHLQRAAKCDLCGENFKRGDERQLHAIPDHPNPFRHVAAHPDCVTDHQRKTAERHKEFVATLARGAELIAQYERGVMSTQRLREMGMII